MKSLPLSWIRGAAAALLVGGGAWAGSIARAPVPSPREDPNLRALASRVSAEAGYLPEPALSEYPYVAPARPAPRRTATFRLKSLIPALPTNIPALPPAPGAPGAPLAGTAAIPHAEAPVKPADPGRNLALVGVTAIDDRSTAWLLDTGSRSREQAPVGGSVFGFQVAAIGADSVTLVRRGQKLRLRLGERQTVNLLGPAETGPRGEAARAAASAPVTPAPRRSSDRRSPAGESTNSTTGSPGPTTGGSPAGSRPAGSRYGGSGAPFGGAPWGGAGGQNGGAPASQFSGAASGPTSNPQTARRRGAPLVGGEAPLPAPGPLANPQTNRRIGTAAGPQGSAFGQTAGTVAGQVPGVGGTLRRTPL